MEATETQITLGEMPVGCRLLVRSRTDWRVAVVARVVEGQIVLSVASPRGRNYRLRRDSGIELANDGPIPYLVSDYAEKWRDNFSRYDSRW
ncbi:MAG TPA: hypothetical protein VGQ55_03775 [Pyrinomonadaceae bacterium]|jgi:hypothetical protein|nr:hypothetical protein [Pyrinomonadaceae bacterium]